MSDVKKLLVVDDRYEMLDFLQSMLELTSEDYEVVAVPSAEEALLELRHANLDLLITDARLPGMSGFDLVRRMRRSHPDIPAIMITAYSSEQGQVEAEDLGVYRYFEKPLDTDEVLTAVHTALYGELVVHADSPTELEELELVVPDAVSKRLETLRADTGATRLVLATTSGHILLQIGQGQELNVSRLSTLMARSLDNSFLLAKELGGDDPTTIQYLAGERIELYLANVGHDFFLAFFFDSQTRRGRMSTIWVFAQQATKDLLSMLPSVDEIKDSKRDFDVAPVPEEAPPTVYLKRDEVAEALAGSPPTASGDEARPEPAVSTDVPVDADALLGLERAANVDTNELDSFWETAIAAEDAGQVAEGGLSLEEARRQQLITQELEWGGNSGQPRAEDSAADKSSEAGSGSAAAPAETAPFLEELMQVDSKHEETDLDSYWNTALAEEGGDKDSMTSGFSYEEAKRRGLLSEDSGTDGNQD